MNSKIPWVSFCISTYKRPEFLKAQLLLLTKQTFKNFEIVVSDNDPQKSAEIVVHSVNDDRIFYYSNIENIGMMKSFNQSIIRSKTEYIVMVTDDDPIETDFLETMHNIYSIHPNFSIYAGFLRKEKQKNSLEIIEAKNFIEEILNPSKTINLLWSSAILRKRDAISIGLIPDFGSPHLADHAFIAKLGAEGGGAVLNKIFSKMTPHDSNFSKSKLEFYVIGCQGFYEFMTKNSNRIDKKVIKRHLENWFIATMFYLRKYYTVIDLNHQMINEINHCADKMLKLHFMKSLRIKYYLKKFIFYIKYYLGFNLKPI